MSEYHAVVEWERRGARFTDNRYSREHRWLFDEGVSVAASASPHIVPLPYSSAAAVDPEEAFVAALSSCHMLFFLAFARKDGFVVDSYRDDAEGTLGKDERGKMSITEVVLRPAVTWSGDTQPDAAAIADLHHRAHDICYIANSVRAEVKIEPR